MIRGYVSGEAVEGFADELYAELEPRMVSAVEDASEMLAAEARRLLSRKGPPIHGGPPAKVTGELQEAINALPIRKRKRGIRGGAGVWIEDPAKRHEIAVKAMSLEYGRAVKNVVGTRKGKRSWKNKMVKDVQKIGRIPPFPFMRPAEEAMRERIEKRLEDL